MLRQIKLHGAIGEKYGIEHSINADTLPIVVSGLEQIGPEVKRDMRSGKFLAILEKNDTKAESDFFPVPPEMKMMNLGKDYHTVHLIPVVEGEAPVVMLGLAAGSIGIGVGIGAGATFLGLAASSWIMMGISFALSGISALLAPSPEISDPLGSAEDNASTPSFLFNGAVNVTEQGSAVPLVYGTTRTGSVVISAGLSTEEIPV